MKAFCVICNNINKLWSIKYKKKKLYLILITPHKKYTNITPSLCACMLSRLVLSNSV